MTHNNDLPLIILTGHRKSGTSLFHRLFDGLDSIQLYPVDFSILYAYFPCFTDNHTLDDSALRTRLMRVLEQSLQAVQQYYPQAFSGQHAFLDLVQQKISAIDLRDKTQVISAVCEAWSLSQSFIPGAAPFMFKETSQSVYFDELRQRFKQLKMISIIRDPRDNFAAIHSGIAHYYSRLGEAHVEALSSHINRARMDLMSARINQQLSPDAFLAIQFEQLVAEPETTMRQVADFLQIEFDPRMLTPQINGQAYCGNNYDGKTFSGISSQHVGAWKHRIDEADAKIIEYWMADEMAHWGYACAYTRQQSQQQFAQFYARYNCRYFFHDSFATVQP